MSLIRMNFFSRVLNRMTAANAILPLPRSGEISELPVLYLLHGMGDDHTSWQRQTAIERYALEAGLAVIMPEGELSTYHNMAHGRAYNDFIAQELPEIMGDYFPISRKREKTFIAGCSMGGFGALKIALARPEKYAAIGCFSAAIMEYRPESAFVQQALWRAYGGDIDASDASMLSDAQKVSSGKNPVRIYHSWGDEDRLRVNAEKTQAILEALASPALVYDAEMLSGGHDWATWDQMIQKFIAWLDLPRPKERLF